MKNFVGRASVVVSCVTKEQPYRFLALYKFNIEHNLYQFFRPHPHNLIGSDGCQQGVYYYDLDTTDMIMVLTRLGIQCVRRKDVGESLRVRKEKQIDPFGSKTTSIF